MMKMSVIDLVVVIAMGLIPIAANAGETSILYYQNKIPGPQISKDYYIKESVKRVDPKNKTLLQVRTHSTVKSPEGTTKYTSTLQIDCKAKKFTTIKAWSSGFGEDNGLIVNGKWENLADWDGPVPLAKKICPKK